MLATASASRRPPAPACPAAKSPGSGWQAQSLPGGGEVLALAAVDPSHARAGGTAGGRAFLSATSDGGMTWKAAMFPAGHPAIRGLAATDPTHAWAVPRLHAGRRSVAKAVAGATLRAIAANGNGGKTWYREAVPDAKPLAAVVLANRSAGWVGGGTGVLATIDGGTGHGRPGT